VYVIILNGEPAGTVGLDHLQPLISSVDIGYWLRTDLNGRGLMTEAAAAVVEYAFEELAIHRIELRAGVENYGSLRVAEKLGFRRGGELRHGAKNVRDYYDVYVFDLLATDERTAVRRRVRETSKPPQVARRSTF
jgi:ribosomal-protein-serine acetyltransferase